MKPAQERLASVATVIMGTSPKGETYNETGEGLPLLNGPTEFGPSYPTCTLYTTDSKKECLPGDLIFCVRGSTTGRMNWADKVYSLGRGVCSIRGATHSDTKYIRYCIEDRLEALLKLAGGGTFPNLTQDSIRDFVIPFSPHRAKIAGVLSAYDDLIVNNTRRIAILEEMAQAIYREWFVNFRFQGHEKVKLVDSPLGKIPEGWKPQTIGSTLDFHIGGGWGQDATDDEFINPAFVIRGTDIPEARSLRVVDCPLRFHTDSNIRTRTLRPNDLVFEVSGGSKGQPVGRCLFVSQRLLKQFDGEVICASFCKLIRANPAILAPEVLYHFLLESYTDGTIEQYEVQSTGIKNFKFKVFLESESLAVPPAQVQKAFVAHVHPILDAVHALGKKAEILRNTRDLLLPKLISGQLDVEELDIDAGEPIVETEA